MPKNNKVVKKDNVIYKSRIPHKFRIGTRKNGTSASLMSVAALKELLADSSKKRYHNKARNVLQSRTV